MSDAQFNSASEPPALVALFEGLSALNFFDVPELNVRTYVTAGGLSGVWFLSIDLSKWLTAELFRLMFHLNAHDADMSMATDRQPVTFRSRRTEPGQPPAEFVCRYRPVGEPFPPERDPIDEFLHVRDRMFTVDERGDLYRGDVGHPPWQLYEADATIDVNSMTIRLTEARGLFLRAEPDRRRYVRETASLVFPPERVGGNAGGGGRTVATVAPDAGPSSQADREERAVAERPAPLDRREGS